MGDQQLQRIENHILKVELLDIDHLVPLQGGLKTISDENFNKLRASLIDNGFQFTVHVWESGGVIYIIDGHQRVHVMKQLRSAGWEIPPITCAFVKASNYHEAKKLILYAISQYGVIDNFGFDEFTVGEGFDLDNFKLPDFEIGLSFTYQHDEDVNSHFQDGKSQPEKLDSYLNSSIREIKLQFLEKEYGDVMAAFSKLRDEYGVANNSELVRIFLGLK